MITRSSRDKQTEDQKLDVEQMLLLQEILTEADPLAKEVSQKIRAILSD